MTTEKNLWLRVKKNLPHDCYATRIENRMDGGVPDVHVIWDGLPFWIELKLTKANKISIIIVDSNAIFLIIINLLVFHIIYLKHIK